MDVLRRFDVNLDSIITLLGILRVERLELLRLVLLPVINIHAVRLAFVNIFKICVSLGGSSAQNRIDIITNPYHVRDSLLV